MTEQQAMRMALEALEIAADGGGVNFYEYAKELRQYLEQQPADEPVDFEAIIEDIEAISCYYHGSPSYEHCPYKIRKEAADTVRRHAGYYTRPQPAAWVSLTDEEVEEYEDWADFQVGCGRQTLFDMIRDIEAKLKEKNT